MENNMIDRSVAPEVHSFGPLELRKPWSEKFDNGCTLHVLRGDDTDVCRFTVAIPGGEAHNSKSTPMGIVSQMLLEGTERLPGEAIAASLEDRGAWCGTGVSTQYTTLTVSCLSEHLPALLPVCRDIIFSPKFDPEDVGKVLERLAAQNEVNRCKVTWQASMANASLVYGADHPLAFVLTPDEIRSLSPDVLRQAHYSRLDTHHMHIFLSGGVSRDITEMVRREFGMVVTGCDFPVTPTPFPYYESGGEAEVDMPEAMQSAVTVTIPAPGRDDPDFVRLRIAVIALGGYFGSRLMLNIREDKGLTYGISACLPAFRQRSFITISTQCDCANTGEVKREIFRELERMKDPSTFTDDELSRLSRYILSGLATVLDTPVSRMDFLQSVFLAGARDGYFAEQDTMARSVTAEWLSEMATKYFDASLAFVTVAGRSVVTEDRVADNG